MGEDSSYSIWLAPEEDSALHSRLQQEIRRLSQENAGTAFAPHVTLIGGIVASKDDVISKTEELASNLKVILVACNAHCKCAQI
jgi:2'-5' RNA ligase